MMNTRVTNLEPYPGTKLIEDTAVHERKHGWRSLVAVGGNAVIAAVVAPDWLDASELDGFTIADGTAIYGQFTSVQLTSGKVIAYA